MGGVASSQAGRWRRIISFLAEQSSPCRALRMLLGEQDSSSDAEVEEFRDLVRKRSDIEKKMDYIDEEAKQVKLALELQKSMTDCYSSHASDCPLQTSVELKCFATGSSFAAFSIRNSSKFDLKDWSISVSICPATSEVSCSYSQSASLIHLAPDEVFTSELFFPHQYLHLPVLFHLKLTRMFYLQNEAKYICINLGDEFLSLRDQIYQVYTPLPAVDRDLSNVLGSFTLQIPCCLVDLLAGCPDNDDPVNALRVLLPRDRFQSLPAGMSSTDALLVLNQSQKHPLRGPKYASWSVLRCLALLYSEWVARIPGWIQEVVLDFAKQFWDVMTRIEQNFSSEDQNY
uniref:Mab-21 domain-containing protein n=1 Tax=Angiostrongylus cantonensis TaxID=6313 RepID=A0A158PAB0_ANGCA